MEPHIGRSGWLAATCFTVEALDQAEDHLIVAAITDTGEPLDGDVARRLLSLPGEVVGEIGTAPQDAVDTLDRAANLRRSSIQREISERNAKFFEAEAEKLDTWAEDMKVGLEREIKELDRQIKEARRAASLAPTLEEKLAGQKALKALEGHRNQKRRSLFDAQDELDRQRAELIARIEGKLSQRIATVPLFMIRWSVGGH